MSDQTKDVFAKIYQSRRWGGQSRSGPGSDLESNAVYVGILQMILNRYSEGIKSVLDVGCGDWSLAKEIDWGARSYIGIDVVPDLIESNKNKYATHKITFDTKDLTKDELPGADLLVIKDVLQHLSNESVTQFLRKLDRYKFALITNDVRSLIALPIMNRFFVHYPKANKNIKNGGWRSLELRRPPFILDAVPLAYYDSPAKKWGMSITFTKEILFLSRETTSHAPTQAA